ncbi:MAG: hypothetical protein ACUVRH_05080 [Candidatus Bipolaricaulia bacterium]
MIKKFGVLMMVLVVIALFGIVRPAPDRNIVYSEELAPEGTWVETPQYCWTEYRYCFDIVPWHVIDEFFSCVRTWRCWFFLEKGAYWVYIWEKEEVCQVYQCCRAAWWMPKECYYQGDETRTRYKRTHEFLYCGC